MITADRNIIIFNKTLDPETRRGVFIPTAVSGVSYHENLGTVTNDINRSQQFTYKLRIPVSAAIQGDRTYIKADRFKEAPEGHWTLHGGDYVLVMDPGAEAPELDGTYTEPEVKALAGTGNFSTPEILIMDYADNTLRGSDYVRHWRIGGK